MSDKNLTELEWKKFSKGKGFKDAPFLKALAALELGKTPAAKLEALADIEKQADVLRKANKADKELGSYLDDAEKAAGKERKLQEAEAKKAAKPSSSEDEEDDSPAALTTKMIPLLRQVKKGEVMRAMVAITGKEVAVLVSKKPIGPPKRKLLTDYLGVSGGVKFAVGEVIWEENANTFVLSTQAAGLAKKIKAALLKQLEQRFKVRVRGEDPNDIDDDGEPAPEQEGGEREGEGGTKAESNIPPAPPLPEAGEQAKPKQEAQAQSDEAAAFTARLTALMPKVKETITAAGPNATDVKLKVSEAGVLARKKEFGNANALLDEAERLMGAGNTPEAPPLQQQPDDAAVFKTRLTALMPRVKESITAAGPNATDVKLKFSEAGVFARKKEFDRAHALLDEAEQLMDADADGPSEAEEFAAHRDELEQRMLAALKGDPAEATRMRAVFGYANEQAGSGQWAKAMGALDRLDKMLGGTGSRDLPTPSDTAGGEPQAEVETQGQGQGQGTQKKAGPGIVQQRKFMLERWARIPAELNVELQTLTKVLSAEGGDLNPKELAAAIDTHLQDLLGEIKDQLDDCINDGDMAPIKGLRTRVESDGVMAHLLKAPFMDGSRFKRAVLDAMDEIEAGLTA